MRINDDQHPQSAPTSRPGEWDQFTRQAAIVILLLAVLLLISILRPLLSLLAVTGTFILILSYPVNALRARTRLAYPVAVLVVFIPIAILLFILFSSMLRWNFENAQALLVQLQRTLENAQSIKAFLGQVPGGTFIIEKLSIDLSSYFNEKFVLTMQFIAFTSVSFFLAFLFILEMPSNLAHSFQSMSDVSQREFGLLFDRLSNVWNGWLRSTVITSIIIGISTALVLFLFGIPYAGVLGVVAGFLNLIPTFGPLVSYLLIIFVTYTQGSTRVSLAPATLTLLVWAVLLVINQVVRLYIFPRLAGKAVHLPVFLVILGLVVAAFLWGVIGVVLVVPLLGSVRELLNYVLAKINRRDPFPGEQPAAGFWAREISEQ